MVLRSSKSTRACIPIAFAVFAFSSSVQSPQSGSAGSTTFHSPICRTYRGETVCHPGGGVSAPKLIRPKTQTVLDAGANRASCPCRVALSSIVEKDGHVSESKIRLSVNPELDRRAIAEVKTWLFQPAQYLQEPVAVEIDIEVKFQ